MFRSWFSIKAPPWTETPTAHRVKRYSAQTGFVYQYSYQGRRQFPASSHPPHGGGTEFGFRVSADGKNWLEAGVFLEDAAVGAWELNHARAVSSAERYAVAKLALFQAFDERARPALLKRAIHVRAADVDAILGALDS